MERPSADAVALGLLIALGGIDEIAWLRACLAAREGPTVEPGARDRRPER